MKKFLSMIMILVMALSICACGGTEDNAIAIKGVFKLDAEKTLALDKEVEKNLQPLLVVFDIAPLGDENVELSSWDDSVELTFNNGNSYEQSTLKSFKYFMEYSGYLSTKDDHTIWGGSEETTRMVTLFVVNKNDLTDDFTATINFDLADKVSSSKEISAEETQTISLYDGIFAVEENAEMHQIAKSIPRRADVVKGQREASTTHWNSQDRDSMVIDASIMQVVFSEEAKWGVSCGLSSEGKVIYSESLPTYTSEALELVPECKASVENLVKSIEDFGDIADEGDFSTVAGIKLVAAAIDLEVNNIKNTFLEY